MAFWGVHLKPNEPYTLHYDDGDAVPKRLRITQATLGDATRNSPARSIVRCSIGDKPAIAICSLSIRELTCCQLELEFEESHDIIFSVMGPRGVYLAGYLITPASTVHQHTIDRNGQDEAIAEMDGCSDHDFHEDELDFIKRASSGPVEESVNAENTEIKHCDKNIKGGKRLQKCFRGKNRGKIIKTLDRKMGKDANEDQEKYINQQLCSSDEDQEKTATLKAHSVFGRLLEEKRDAIEKKKKKMKKKRNKKRKPSTSEATASEYVSDPWDEKFGSDSRITEEKGSSPDARERSHNKAKERKNKNKRKHTLDYKNHNMEHFKNRRAAFGNVEEDC